jgi:hypothetical protein
LLGKIDGRSATARRYRDLIADIIAEHGEPSISDLAVIRAASALIVKSEEMQAGIVRGDGDIAPDEIVRLASESRRLLTGLRRKRDRRQHESETPTLSAYLSEISSGGAQMSSAVTKAADASEASPAVTLAATSRKRTGGPATASARRRASKRTISDDGDAT